MIFETFKPWKEGNFPIWALSRIDNINKHRMILPTLANITWSGSIMQGITPSGGQMMNWNPSITMSPGNHFVVSKTLEPIEFFERGAFTANLAFPGDIPFGGKFVFEVLEELIQCVTRILDALEAHFKGA